MLIIEKDSRIAELDAASTGEMARLGAAVEAAKKELNHLKNDHVWLFIFFLFLWVFLSLCHAICVLKHF